MSGLRVPDGAGRPKLRRGHNDLVAYLTGAAGPILLTDGSAAAPALAFASDTNTGIYKAGSADILGVTAGGTLVAQFSKSGGNVQVLLEDGSVTAPILAFSNDGNTGLYSRGADRIAVTANGTKVAEFAWTSGAGVMLGVGFASGSGPSVGFHVAKTQTGDYVSIIEQVGSSAGDKGVQIKQGSTSASDPILQLLSNGTGRFSVLGNGAITTHGGQPLQKASEAAVASGSLTLGAMATVTGCSVSLSPGHWVVEGSFRFNRVDAAGSDANFIAFGQITVTAGTATIGNSTSLPGVSLDTNGGWYQATKSWPVVVTATATVVLQAAKTGGTGSSIAQAPHTSIAAWYLGSFP